MITMSVRRLLLVLRAIIVFVSLNLKLLNYCPLSFCSTEIAFFRF
jgi:hypothetical protein